MTSVPADVLAYLAAKYPGKDPQLFPTAERLAQMVARVPEAVNYTDAQKRQVVLGLQYGAYIGPLSNQYPVYLNDGTAGVESPQGNPWLTWYDTPTIFPGFSQGDMDAAGYTLNYWTNQRNYVLGKLSDALASTPIVPVTAPTLTLTQNSGGVADVSTPGAVGLSAGRAFEDAGSTARLSDVPSVSDVPVAQPATLRLTEALTDAAASQQVPVLAAPSAPAVIVAAQPAVDGSAPVPSAPAVTQMATPAAAAPAAAAAATPASTTNMWLVGAGLLAIAVVLYVASEGMPTMKAPA